MNLNPRLFKLAAIAALILSPAAFAGTSFSIVAAPTYMMATSSGLPTGDVAPADGGIGAASGGLLIEMGSPKFGFEFGGIYSNRPTSASASFTSVKIPAMLKFHLSPSMNLQLGGYYNHQLSQTGDYKINSTIVDGTDYGAQGGLGFRFPMGSGTALRIDALYAYALKNVATSGTLNLTHAQLQVGLQFGGAK